MKIKIKNFVFAGFAAAIFAGHAMAAGDTIVTSKAYVDQKLGLKANTADLAPVATSGSYTDLTNTPSIPAAQVNADWNASSGVAQILNKPTLSAVATSGSYNDLSNKPTIPTVPTNVSAFTNDANYITSADVPAQVNADWNATSGAGEILNKPTTLAGYGITDAATSAQGALADTAVQPSDLATVATTGSYNDLSNKPTIPAAQVNADWNSTSGVSQILNKPTLSAVATSGNYSDLSGTPNLATVATSGSYTDLADKPTIPAAQVQSDWNATTGMGAILNKPTLGTAAAAATTDFATAAQGALADTAVQPGDLATVATSGNYSDLSGTPDLSGYQLIDNKVTGAVATWTEATKDTKYPTIGAIKYTQNANCDVDNPCAWINNQWVRIAQVGDQ